MKLSNETYDILKEIALTVLPAMATLYAVLGEIWGLPLTTEIPATIMAIDTAMGAVLHISTKNYQKEDEHASMDS